MKKKVAINLSHSVNISYKGDIVFTSFPLNNMFEKQINIYFFKFKLICHSGAGENININTYKVPLEDEHSFQY